MQAVLTIALAEVRQLLRSRWLLAYAACLALLGGVVVWLGEVMLQAAGITGFGRTAASLIGLMLYLVPLAAMLTTVPAFTDGQGLYRQLLCEPVSRYQLVSGKILGLVIGNAAAVCVGFGFCAVVAGWRAGWPGLAVTGILALLSIVCSAVYASVAALLTVAAGRTFRAYIGVLGLLFVSTVLFDVILMGLGLVLPPGTANRIAFIGIFINPADALRICGMLLVGGREALGVAAVLLSRSLGGDQPVVLLLLASLLAWVALPAWAAGWLLGRQDS